MAWNKLHIQAPAKLNLSLKIVGKRDDGYHELESVMTFVNMCDEITIKPSEKLCFSILGEFSSQLSNEDNLVLKAANFLRKYRNQEQLTAAILLEKNIPVGAGLGGGSADAAATLIGLNKFWGMQLKHEELHALAIKLGADVPVCLIKKTCLATGIGDKYTLLKNTNELFYILVNPGIHVSTAAMYAKVKSYSPKGKAVNKNYIEHLKVAYNDFEPIATVEYPEIKIVITALKKQQGCIFSRMSGSGSTCFAAFTSETLQQEALLKLKNKYPDWWIKTAKSYK